MRRGPVGWEWGVSHQFIADRWQIHLIGNWLSLKSIIVYIIILKFVCEYFLFFFVLKICQFIFVYCISIYDLIIYFLWTINLCRYLMFYALLFNSSFYRYDIHIFRILKRVPSPSASGVKCLLCYLWLMELEVFKYSNVLWFPRHYGFR